MPADDLGSSDLLDAFSSGSLRLVSVILPVYNEAAHIEEVVLSILNQSHPNFDLEIVVIDGKSTDGTLDKLQRIADSNPAVRLLVNERRKTPFAFNMGLTYARGEYACIFGAHTAYDPDYIYTCLQELKARDAVGCGGRVITTAANASLQAKLVGERRGGYCFEQNGLFLEALTALGFQVSPLSARVRIDRPRQLLPPRTHLFLRVAIAGESWLTDVGVGALSLTRALRFGVEGEHTTVAITIVGNCAPLAESHHNLVPIMFSQLFDTTAPRFGVFQVRPVADLCRKCFRCDEVLHFGCKRACSIPQ